MMKWKATLALLLIVALHEGYAQSRNKKPCEPQSDSACKKFCSQYSNIECVQAKDKKGKDATHCMCSKESSSQVVSKLKNTRSPPDFGTGADGVHFLFGYYAKIYPAFCLPQFQAQCEINCQNLGYTGPVSCLQEPFGPYPDVVTCLCYDDEGGDRPNPDPNPDPNPNPDIPDTTKPLVSLHLAKTVCKQQRAYARTNSLQTPVKTRAESGSQHGCGWYLHSNNKYNPYTCKQIGAENAKA